MKGEPALERAKAEFGVMSPVSLSAPRVLLDATSVPADRGGVGRYVDGLIGALAEAGIDLVVAAQRSDAERFTRLASGLEVIAGPSAISHRPARATRVSA